jgi:hypothetical protein
MYRPQVTRHSRAGLQVVASPFGKLRAGPAGLTAPVQFSGIVGSESVPVRAEARTLPRRTLVCFRSCCQASRRLLLLTGFAFSDGRSAMVERKKVADGYQNTSEYFVRKRSSRQYGNKPSVCGDLRANPQLAL